MKTVLTEAVLIALLGLAVSFAANSFSSRGLKLTKDYFPGRKPTPNRVTHAGTNTASPGPTAIIQSPAERALARLHEKGLQVVEDAQVPVLFQDPNYQTGGIVFVDARDDDHYQKGHIPSAYQLDHVYPQKYLGTVLPACNAAQQIVVYCGGGDCEKSEFAAELLRSAVPNEKIYIYAGGLNDWQARKLPIETGDRKSGQITTGTP